MDAETEHFKHDKVDKAFSKALQQARLAKKMNQKQLATVCTRLLLLCSYAPTDTPDAPDCPHIVQAINEKPQVINQYESGKAIPNGAVVHRQSSAEESSGVNTIKG